MSLTNLSSAKDIENVAFDILNRSKSLGIFPTPINKIVQYTELKVSKKDLSVIPANYIGKANEALKKALRKVRGALDRQEKTIYLDLKQISARNKFTKLHETGHHVLPWQRKMYEYVEDDKLSLNPDTEEEFEAEANFFASSILFQLDRFEEEMGKLPLALNSSIVLAKMFGSSIHASLRRYVERSNRRCALIVLNKYEPVNQVASLRDYFQSPKFSNDFGMIHWSEVIGINFPFIVDMAYNKRFNENGLMNIEDPNNGTMSLKYHFFDNSYNGFVLIMPVGETNKSRTSIITNY